MKPRSKKTFTRDHTRRTQRFSHWLHSTPSVRIRIVLFHRTQTSFTVVASDYVETAIEFNRCMQISCF
uniref:Uncharacterized protein n=1 Tax=Ciona intestinalis TaxID=7719 RepID=H2XSZ4_CIOIN